MAKAKDLVIVESPAKAKTIEKYLGGDYKVKASTGGICPRARWAWISSTASSPSISPSGTKKS